MLTGHFYKPFFGSVGSSGLLILNIGWSVFLVVPEGFEYVLHKPSGRSVYQDCLLSLCALYNFLISFFVLYLLSCLLVRLFLRQGLNVVQAS